MAFLRFSNQRGFPCIESTSVTSDGTNTTVSFNPHQGSNNFFGGYSIKNGILTIGNAGMTRKMCDPKTMENEAVLTENFLNAETKILTLKDNEEVGKIFLLGKDFYLVLD